MTTDEKLDLVLKELRRLKRRVGTLSQPVELLTPEAVCGRLKVSRSSLEQYDAAGLFTDARPVGKRCRGRSRLYFADEVDVYVRTRSAADVKRFRRSLGRLAGEPKSRTRNPL